MLSLYANLALPPSGSTLPSDQIVNEDWALFLWLQVRLLFEMDIYCRFGGRATKVLSGKSYQRTEHDVLDAQYLVFDTLERTCATREERLQRWVSLLCPKGQLCT